MMDRRGPLHPAWCIRSWGPFAPLRSCTGTGIGVRL